MANLLRPHLWEKRLPPPGSQIDWGHPLAQGLGGLWLHNQGGGNLSPSLVNPNDVFRATDTPIYTSKGVEPANAGANARFLVTTPSSLLTPPKVTMLWRGMMLGDATSLANSPPIMAMGSNNIGGQPFYAYALTRTTNQDTLTGYGANSGSLQAYGPYNRSFSSRYNQPMQLAISFGGAGGPRMYDGGVAVISGGGGTFSGAYVGVCYLTTMNHNTAGTSNTSMFSGAVWDRALNEEEFQWLAAEPYAMIYKPKTISYYFMAAAAAATNDFHSIARGVRRGISRGAA